MSQKDNGQQRHRIRNQTHLRSRKPSPWRYASLVKQPYIIRRVSDFAHF